MSVTVPAARNRAVSHPKKKKNPCTNEAYIVVREPENEEDKGKIYIMIPSNKEKKIHWEGNIIYLAAVAKEGLTEVAKETSHENAWGGTS